MKVYMGIFLPLLMLAANGAEPDTDAAGRSPDETNKQRPVTSQEDSKTSPGPVPKAVVKKKSNPDIFKPSEEISEDFAVSFPVDI